MTDNPATDFVADKAIDDDAGLALAQMAKDGRPTRADDTVVIEGGWRATLEEVQAYIAADATSRGDG